MNKSLLTNLTALIIALSGTFGPEALRPLAMAGWFALSGAATNWLAIFMLFERVPFLYGSGIIPNKFEAFKAGIHDLIMEEFFSADNIERFLEDQLVDGINLTPLVDAIDFDKLFIQLTDAVESSSFGPMLAMMGGKTALEPVKPEFIEKVRAGLLEMAADDQFKKKVSTAISKEISHEDHLKSNIDNIVSGRLSELTPEIVKDIIQKMIREHLGWLVIWGGVFGGLIGLIGFFVSR